MEKSSNILTMVKNAVISALVGHGVSVLLLLFISAALSKNEDPSVLMPAGALVAFFIGSLVCGALSAKLISGPLAGALSGGFYILLLIIVSLVINFVTKETVGIYPLGTKLLILFVAALISFLAGLFVNTRKSSRRALLKRRKTAGR
ncbi:MAG: hypothetical protein E7626_04865 [Ruminococcaceae bacterium]|nr:hypothetical protein [Oscillospiraceae bacterium]